jgi:hypothetical protein
LLTTANISLPFASGTADPEQLKQAIMRNLARMDHFIPMAMAVIYANTPPERAVTAARRKRSTRARGCSKTGTPFLRRRFSNN